MLYVLVLLQSKVTVTVTIVRSSHHKAAKTPGKLTSRAFGTSIRFEKGTVDGKRSSTCKPESEKLIKNQLGKSDLFQNRSSFNVLVYSILHTSPTERRKPQQTVRTDNVKYNVCSLVTQVKFLALSPWTRKSVPVRIFFLDC